MMSQYHSQIEGVLLFRAFCNWYLIISIGAGQTFRGFKGNLSRFGLKKLLCPYLFLLFYFKQKERNLSIVANNKILC